MGFIEKLKLLFKIRQPATDLINEVKAVPSGYKTLPFWITVVTTLLSIAGALQGLIPASTAVIITTALTAIYNILRGATKADVPGTKPVVQTSEFLVGILGSISAALVSLQTGGINPAWMATALTVIGAAMAAAQNLAGQQPTPQ